MDIKEFEKVAQMKRDYNQAEGFDKVKQGAKLFLRNFVNTITLNNDLDIEGIKILIDRAVQFTAQIDSTTESELGGALFIPEKDLGILAGSPNDTSIER